MSESAERVARAFVAAINRQDVDALAALMTAEHCFIDSLGNAVRGREAMRAAWTGYFKMVPDYSIAMEEAYSNGAVVVLLGVVQGTYAADGELKPENRWQTPAALRAAIEDGQVAEWRVYADNEPIRQKMAKRG
jgi:ketosteroid isomerase-like protein